MVPALMTTIAAAEQRAAVDPSRSVRRVRPATSLPTAPTSTMPDNTTGAPLHLFEPCVLAHQGPALEFPMKALCWHVLGDVLGGYGCRPTIQIRATSSSRSHRRRSAAPTSI